MGKSVPAATLFILYSYSTQLFDQDFTFILMAQSNRENSCYAIFKVAAISLW